VVQTHLLTNMVRGPIEAPNAYGHEPFVDGNFTKPRIMPGPANDYWDHADYVIALAAKHDMYVAMVAAWSNSLRTDDHLIIGTIVSLAYNLQSNPHAAYIFLEEGPGHQGKRLYLTRVGEESDPKTISALSRRRKPDKHPDEKKFLVRFHVDKVLPAVATEDKA